MEDAFRPPARTGARLLSGVDEPYKTMVGLIAATGLRIGELLAVRWRALDLDVGTLAVRESVYEGKIQRPKTQKSRRTTPLGPHAITLLKEHRDRSARKSDDDLVFPNKSRRTDARIEAAGARAPTGGGTCGARARDVASVPPHSFVAAQRSARAGEDRARATRAREHLDDAQHLHARRRRVASAAVEALERQLFPTVPKSPKADTPSDALSVTKRAG